MAVIGASNNLGKWGFSTLMSIRDGFKGKIYPVNNRRDDVLGLQSYQRVTDIPAEVDLAVFVIPAANIDEVMQDCVEKGVKAALIISAGFSETGEEGKILQDRVVKTAAKGGIRIVGPNCMGFWSAPSHLRAFMFPMSVLPGPLGFVSQGGNVGGAIVMAAYERGIGFDKYVSCGCTADIQIEDYIEHFGDDPNIKVILTYIEGLADGRRFIEKVRKVTTKKPVIAMKPGRTLAAAQAIASHSGALSGSDDVYEAAFKETGVIRVDSGGELLDVAMGFLTQPLPRNNSLAIITPGGSYGVICADACASLGLRVVSLSQETLDELDRLFPPRWSHGNPVDPAGDRNFISYLQAPPLLLELDEIGSLIYMGFGSFSSFASSLSFFERDETVGVFSSFLSGITGSEGFLQSMRSTVEEGDRAGLQAQLELALTALVSIMGSAEEEEVAQLRQMVSSLMDSGRIVISAEDFDQLAESMKHDRAYEAFQNLIINRMDDFLTALIVDWIERYGKPVVSTSFTETVPGLIGGIHYSYPSGERAALVLSKMARYREYLEKEGIWKEGEFDPFTFTLLGNHQ